jgi:cell division protein FtsW
MITQKKYNYVDLITLFSVILLMGMSVLVVYSASVSWALDKQLASEQLLNLHILKVAIALMIMFLAMNIDYHKYKNYTKAILIISICLLVLTIFIGFFAKGASRWLRYGGFGLQPSELAKYALIFHFSTMIVKKEELIRDLKKGYLPMLIWLLIVTGLVMKQPNFSTALMIVVISFTLMYIAGVRVKHLFWTVISMLPFVYLLMTSGYRSGRSGTYIDYFNALLTVDVSILQKASDKLHQLWQSILGFGSGGLFGVGIGNSKQRDLFLPESFGDFIFSIVGEEYGLLGTSVFMLLFLMILIRGFKIARYAQDDYGRTLAIGITLSIVIYAFVNAGVTLGLLPTTGLPMPFVSYGGTAIIISGYAVGVLLNISRQTDLNPKPAKVPIIGTVSAEGKKVQFE